MVDEAPAPGAGEDDVHDDDELAEALAAELERYATGAVPVVGQRATTAAVRIDPAVPQPAPPAPPPGQDPSRAAVATPTPMPAPASTLAPSTAFRRERPRPAPAPNDLPAAEEPIRRRTGFRPPPLPQPVDPVERVLPTGPIALPEATGSLLESMIEESRRPSRRARRDPVDPAPPPVEDVLRGTGPLPVPRPLYEDWEQSLRSIGRPRDPWDDGEPMTGGAPTDTPTVALAVQRTGRLPGPSAAPAGPPADGPEPAAAEASSVPRSEPEGATRRSGRRRADAPVDAATGPLPAFRVPSTAASPVAPPEPAESPVAPMPGLLPDAGDAADADDLVEEEGVDDVVDAYPTVSAAATGAVEVPSMEPRTRTGPVLIDRVRTALLQLPAVPSAATGTGGAGIAGRLAGIFASPLLLVAGFAVGSGPLALAAGLLGVLLAVPAAARTAAWGSTAGPVRLLEAEVLGRRAGAVVAVVLLLARLAALAVVLLGVGDLAAAYVGRSGAFGGSSSAASVAGVLVAGLVALAVAALPVRATAVLVLLLGAVGLVGTAVVLLVLGPGGGGAAAPAAPAGAVGFALVGLLAVLVLPDAARWPTAIARRRGAAIGAALGLLAAAVLLLLALQAGAGSQGDGPDDLAGALVDATAAPLAAPIGVLLLASSLALPVLLTRAAGGAAARVLGGGRSERLGAVAAALLALAAALGLVSASVPSADAVLVIGAVLGVPVAAWAGLLVIGALRGGTPAALVAAVATVLGWALSDCLVLVGERSPVLDLVGLGAASGLRGDPVLGLTAAFVLAALGGAVLRAVGRGGVPSRSVPDPAAPAVDSLAG